jgi:hypothetical protein
MSSSARGTRLSVESLETRETPSSLTTPMPSDSASGPGVYKTSGGGMTWAAPESGTAAKSSPLPVLLVIADQRDF